MLKAVIWDFDGTICDTYPAIVRAVNEALSAFGASASRERIIELSSISMDGCIRTLAQDLTIPYEDLNRAFALTYQTITPADQPPFPGVVELCQKVVDAGANNFIVSHRRKPSLYRLLTEHGLLAYFQEIITPEDGFPKKPAPDSILHLLTKYGIAPNEALLIGDRDVDILAGQAAGMKTCLFRAAFENIMPTRVITDYSELFDLPFVI